MRDRVLTWGVIMDAAQTMQKHGGTGQPTKKEMEAMRNNVNLAALRSLANGSLLELCCMCHWTEQATHGEIRDEWADYAKCFVKLCRKHSHDDPQHPEKSKPDYWRVKGTS